ncbi:MAG: TetR family transcriptional regulator [Gordonia sp. (in: high G+C Gram-positive bacteria)]|uniref:TetR/AcrR family transcriptional regulator n=1 Tax=Gordonia sp. (in: high G+C Gram-positive bacteria) TaxID=84139 RepID=UPI0039E337E8
MPRRTLTQEAIVDAAVAVAGRREVESITGRVLGEELGVDRSAIWRHFADQDALLRAIGDRLLQTALAEVPEGLAPHDRMTAFARALVSVFAAHPAIGAVIGGRTTRGPGEFAVVEFTLTALTEVGVPADRIAAQQRMIADTVLGYASLRAHQELLPPDLRRGDVQAWSGSYAAASPQAHPAIARHALELAQVSDDQVLEALLEALWASVKTIVLEGE